MKTPSERMDRRILAVCCAIVMLPLADAWAQAAGPLVPGLARPTPEGILVDGRLDEALWLSAREVTLALETSPRSNAPAPVETLCRLTRDQDHLYLGCIARDPRPQLIRAQFVDRDQIETHDRIALYLDTFDDGQRAFVFEVSALGVQSDASFDQSGRGTDYSWNTLWRSAGRITDEGYTIELAIPLGSLRFPSGANREWRFFIERIWPRTEEVTTRSSPRDESNSCVLCDTDRLTAPSADARLANVQLTPTITAARTDRSPSAGAPLARGSVDQALGLDARWGITSGAAIAATINPDFSQVEADAIQLEANNRFALFVPERRDFFLQESELFATPIQAVFTRSISDPIVGYKLTSRSGPYAGGVLYARDAVTTLLLPGPTGSSATTLAQPADVWIARASRSVGESSRVGTLVTHRAGQDYSNSVGSVDAFLRPLPPLGIQIQALGSQTAYPEATQTTFAQPDGAFSGFGALVHAIYSTRDLNLRARLESLGEDLRADAGFLARVGTRSAEGSFVRRFRAEDKSWLTRLDWSGGGWHSETQAGELTDHGLWTALRYIGPWQSSLSVNPFVQLDRFLETNYQRWGLNMSAAVRPNAAIGGFVRVFRGTEVDYENARLADSHELNFSTDFRIGRRLSFDLVGSERRLSLGARPIVRERLSKLIGSYGLSDKLFLRLLGQVRHTRRDPALYANPVDAQALRFESQAIITYRLNGQTAGYLGYSTLASDSRAAGLALAVKPQSQTIFLKFAYAWRP